MPVLDIWLGTLTCDHYLKGTPQPRSTQTHPVRIGAPTVTQRADWLT